MKYLVIDLEMCRVPRDFRCKNYRYANEIIQIGAVLLDDEFKRIGTFSQYVRPDYGVIDPYIRNLTGISNGQVKKASGLQEALLLMLEWIGDDEYRVYAWSGTDRGQLLREIRAKQIEDSYIDAFMAEDRWIDYQGVFSEKYSFKRRVSLHEALERADIEVEGNPHNGLDDAINTGYLIEKLEKHPDFQLLSYETPEKEKRECLYSMGELFAGLDLKFA